MATATEQRQTFKQMREGIALKSADVDELCGFTLGTIDRLESGKTQLSMPQAKAIREKCPLLPYEWLIDSAFRKEE